MEPAGVAQLPNLLANGCSRVVSLLPAGTCMWVGGRRRRKRQRWWRELGVSGGNGGGSSQ